MTKPDRQRGPGQFVELGRYLCEVRAWQYWRVESLKCFDEFLERRFPESRRKAYYLMSMHEHLLSRTRKQLKEVGWAKGIELVKLARRNRQNFDCGNLVAQSRADAEGGLQDGGLEGTNRAGDGTLRNCLLQTLPEPDPVIERAIETAALMLGSDRSRATAWK